MLDWFNNRELSIGIWLLCLFIFTLMKSKIRKSYHGLIKSFFQIKVIAIFLSMVLYALGIVALLKQINYWNTSLLKDTVLWVVFFGVVLLFRFTTTKDNEHQFRRLVFDNLKLVVVLEFIMNTYTFSLFGEIIFIPILSMIVMVSTYSNYHEEYELVAKITDWILAFIGFAVLAYAMTRAFYDVKNFGDLDTIRSFLLPIILAFSFIPFFYLIQVYTLYDSIFTNLKLGTDKSWKLKCYTMLKIIIKCHINVKKLRVILNNKGFHLTQIRNKLELEQLLQNVNFS